MYSPAIKFGGHNAGVASHSVTDFYWKEIPSLKYEVSIGGVKGFRFQYNPFLAVLRGGVSPRTHAVDSGLVLLI